MRNKRLIAGCISVLLFCGAISFAQNVTVTGRVLLAKSDKKAKSSANVVIWLTPVGDTPAAVWPARDPRDPPRLVQKNKSFSPHVLVVPVGSIVQFPNQDPFFHNVFSLFEGKRFDLGLYEAGTTRDVHFDRVGISYIFCNIHAEMSAVVIALNTPYYAISDRRGQLIVPGVPAGNYMMHVWYESALPETLGRFTREVMVSENSSSLGVLRLPAGTLTGSHKNKYGQDYPPPAPDSPTYEHP